MSQEENKGQQPEVAPDVGQQKQRVLRVCGTGYMRWLRQNELLGNMRDLRHVMWVKPQLIEPQVEQNDDNYLMPMQSVSIRGRVQGGIAVLDIDLSYTNEDEEHPLECTYEFPIEPTTVVSKLVATLDDKEIVTKIKEKEKAQEVYDDAIAGGKAAVMATQETEEKMRIQLGNLGPLKEAKLSLQLISKAPVECGSYCFRIPADFCPNYKKLGFKEDQKYSFSVDIGIQSTKKLTQLSVPEGCTVEKNEEGTSANVKFNQRTHEFVVYYRSQQMKYPNLVYAQNPEYPGMMAVHASFVPTFEPPAPQEQFEVLEDEEPEQTVMSHGKDYLFMFIVDRSGSMQGPRIETAKEALKLFLKSLPVGSKFTIISFGTKSQALQIGNGPSIIEYNDKNSIEAIKQIETFSANFGGTNILNPLSDCQRMHVPGYNSYNMYLDDQFQKKSGEPMPSNKKGIQKRIFLLTDGRVRDPNAVIKQAGMCTDNIRTHTFGIGDGCDRDMIKDIAKAGRGSYSLVGDNDSQLNKSVINALKKAFEPSLKGCEIWLGQRNQLKIEKLHEVFRNQTVQKAALIKADEIGDLKDLVFGFHSENDPTTGQSIKVEFDLNQFTQVEDPAQSKALFQLAAHEAIRNEGQGAETSIKYQVLCSETAMVGVMKTKDKSTGEMKQVEFTLKKQKPQQQQQQQYGHRVGLGGYRGGLGRGRGGGLGGIQFPGLRGFGGGAMMKKSAAKPTSSAGTKNNFPIGMV